MGVLGERIKKELKCAIASATEVVAARIGEHETKIHELVQVVAGAIHYPWSDNGIVCLYQKLFITQAAIARLYIDYEIAQTHQVQLTPVSVTCLPIRADDPDCSAASGITLAEASYFPNVAFFTNEENFFSVSPDSVQSLLNKFWCQYDDFISSDPALKTMGLSSDATWPDIKARYRELARAHHPDKGGSTEEFIQIRTAYEQLLWKRGSKF